ncbi:hypothetical protein [Erysipelothrix urinaevulpis]|uniref:hypothetical protein n=1 Tax=Erysipelothrix urinaevulpis TaxID=2683717 RepID=UPI00135A6EB5|nr:hypothetical protein [Erysipelothrix urinaevulpis]
MSENNNPNDFFRTSKKLTKQFGDITKDITDSTIKKSLEIGSGISDIGQEVIKNTSDIALSGLKTGGKFVQDVTNSINVQFQENRVEKELNKIYSKVKKNNEIKSIIEELDITYLTKMMGELGESPIEINDKRISYLKRFFSIPIEQKLLWVDAEFDLKPSGIVLTNEGVFIRSNVEVFSKGVPNVFFFTWGSFDPLWFVVEDEENIALQVEAPHYVNFVAVCRKVSDFSIEDYEKIEKELNLEIDKTNNAVHKKSLIISGGVLSNQESIFVDQKSIYNTKSGHGEMVEEELTRIDKLMGRNAKVLGRDNAKNGADRVVNGMLVQTKYYNSATGSIESSFDSETKMYRYIDNGKPMQLEVPKDQYQDVLEKFKKKIEAGLVDGIKDPERASEIVIEGKLTYKQAVNLTKAGNIDSISYDVKSGAVISLSAFGISFISSSYTAWKTTQDVEKATKIGLLSGVQTSGLTLIQHVLVQQAVRTKAMHILLKPSQVVVEKIGMKSSHFLVNSLRSLSNKPPIYGSAATKHLSKLMRTGVITAGISIAIFSIPDTYKLSASKISGAQYSKNLAILTTTLIGSVGGTMVTGAVLGSVVPGLGNVVGSMIGFSGGLAGGVVASKGAKGVSNLLMEDDIIVFNRMLNIYLMLLITEYMLDENETAKVFKELSVITSQEFQKMSEEVFKSSEQEKVIVEFLTPIFEKVIMNRATYVTPTDEQVEQEVYNFFTNLEYSL